MTRMPADPVGRLAVLEAARGGLKRGRKVIANAEEMATIAGMTWRNLKMIIDADPKLPIEQRGDQGVPWQFNARKVLDYMIGSAKAAQRSREARRAEVNRLAGLGATAGSPLNGGDANGSGSAAEMLQEARAISALVDAQAKLRHEKQKQGSLVDRAVVRSLITEMLTTMQTESLAVTAKIDAAGQWDQGLRVQVDEEVRNVLTTVRDKLEQRLKEWPWTSR